GAERDDDDLAVAGRLLEHERFLDRVGVPLGDGLLAGSVEPLRPRVETAGGGGVRDGLHADGDLHRGETLPRGTRAAGGLAAAQTATRGRRKSTISEVGAPGVKTSATPWSFSAATSSAGIVPPTTTSTSSAPSARSSSRMRGTSVMCAPERIEIPTASAS